MVGQTSALVILRTAQRPISSHGQKENEEEDRTKMSELK